MSSFRNESFGKKALDFYSNLKRPIDLPSNIEIVNPYENEAIKMIAGSFFSKFYNDDNSRYFIFGINPGRFGGGMTGINFTDPVALRKYCGIENDLGNKRELSSQFVYEIINILGGAEKFYSKFFISAVYPLAILKDRKNYNFYDDRKIYIQLKPKIISYIKEQIGFGAKEEVVISLGKKNYIYLKEINEEIRFFKRIEFLEHPRFIMQYRRKRLNDFIKKYKELLTLTKD